MLPAPELVKMVMSTCSFMSIDSSSIPVLTYRTWVLATMSCALLLFLNQFFRYRKELLSITSISAQIAGVVRHRPKDPHSEGEDRDGGVVVDEDSVRPAR